MPLDSLQPRTEGNAGADASTRLLGDTWGPPPAEQPTTVTDNQGQTQERVPSPEPKDQPEVKPEVPQPTEQDLDQMIEQMINDGKTGKLNRDAQDSIIAGMQLGGLQGMFDTVTELNRRLKEAGSEYLITPTPIQHPDGSMDLGFILAKPGEDKAARQAIMTDMLTNGSNSQYKDRGLIIRLTPAEEEGPSGPVNRPPTRA